MNKDRLLLWGAAAVMAATTSFCLWKISRTPAIDPTIERLIQEVVAAQGRQFGCPLPPSIRTHSTPDVWRTIPDPAPAHPWTACIRPLAIGIALPHPQVNVWVLPVPVVDRPRTDLDGTTLTWSLRNPEVDLEPWMDRKTATPEGFMVRRQRGNDPVDTLATLGPQARSYKDVSTEPHQTYRYWVVLVGQESDRSVDPPALASVSKGPAAGVETRIPPAERIKLVGGDLETAVLRVERYDRKEMKWIGRTVLASPGRHIPATGWTLSELTFDKFTLLAHVVDDDGVVHVLSTKD